MISVEYFDEDINGIYVRLREIPSEEITVKCGLRDSNSIKMEVKCHSTVPFFIGRFVPDSYYIVSSENDNGEKQSSSIFYRGEEKEEWFKRLEIFDDLTEKYILKKISDKNRKRAWIQRIYEIYLDNRVDELNSVFKNVLEKIVNDYNNTILANNSRNIDEIIKLDNKSANFKLRYDNYVPENTISIAIIPFDREAIISGENLVIHSKFNKNIIERKIGKGIYSVEVSDEENGRTLYNYIYLSFGDEDSDEKYKNNLAEKEEHKSSILDSNYILGAYDQFKDENEKRILMNLDSHGYAGSVYANLPKISLSDDKMAVTYWDDTLNSCHICFSEEDCLYNKNAEYRTVYCNYSYHDNVAQLSMFEDRNFEEELDIQMLNFNNERYYYWVADGNNTRISKIGTIDFSMEDKTDYNKIYADLVWKKITKTFSRIMNTESKEYVFLRSVLDTISSTEDLAYTKMQNLIEQEVTLRCNDSDMFYKIIYAIESCFLLYDDNYDYDMMPMATYKPAYNRLVWNLCNNDCYMVFKYLKIKEPRDYYTNFLCCFDPEIVSFSIHPGNVEVCQIYNRKNGKLSDFVMFYYKGHENTPRMITNTVRVETINGL